MITYKTEKVNTKYVFYTSVLDKFRKSLYNEYTPKKEVNR